ncbi:MAG: hypothetical protein GY822_23675 [Deltaproteobacteria bacterium]|nr:hypothetical protein [Deltaproteobacteria bacterium]
MRNIQTAFSSILLAGLVALSAGCPETPSEDAGTDLDPVADDAGSSSDDAGSSSDDAGSSSDDAGSSSDDDAGTTPQACGDLTIQGECDGNTLRYCFENAVVESDCDTYFPDGVTATCGEINSNWGFDCKLPVGETCEYANQDGSTFVAFCEDNAGCTIDVVAQTATCVAALGTCTPADDFVPVCNNGNLTVDCQENQPYGIACPGSCDSGTCIDMAEGQRCDDLLVCGDNLTCTGGVCVSDGNTTDAGTPATDAGTAATDAGAVD